MSRLLQQSLSALALFATLSVAPTQAQTQTCPFDDGNSTLTREGLILTRYALGITGAPLVAGTDIAAANAAQVEATILCPSCGLDVNGNGSFDVVDATIITRKLAGLTGDALTDGLDLGNGSRKTSALVQSFLLSGCGATGGTVTSVAAGTGLLGGPITASGTLSADTTYLQRRVATGCAVGSFISAIGADGTPTCATPPAGTVTGVTASAPLASSGGAAPVISLSGAIPMANGGTGLVATGAAGNVLRSTGSAWASAPLQAADVPSLSASYLNNSTTLQTPGAFNIAGNGLIGGTLGIGTLPTTAKLAVAGVIESTSGGVKFPDGTTQTTSAVNRQAWSSNNLLGATTQLVGVANGVGVGGNSFRDPALPLPQSCTASNFTVSVYGATGTSTMSVYLAAATPTQLFGNVASGALSCVVTASVGNVVSCTSAVTYALQTPKYLTLVFQPANTTDFNNARAYTSFTCQ